MNFVTNGAIIALLGCFLAGSAYAQQLASPALQSAPSTTPPAGQLVYPPVEAPKTYPPVEAPKTYAPVVGDAVPAAPTIDPKSLAVAKEIIKSFDMGSLMQGLFGVMSKTIMPLVMRDNPNQSSLVQQFAMDSVQKTFMAHMDALDNNKAIVYAQMYSYDELVQLKTFYQSPVGQKMLKTMPEMMQKTMVLDQDIFIAAINEAKHNMIEELRKNGMKVPKEMEL